MILVTVTSPYRYRVQYINLIHYNIKAKRISQKAVKNMINGNTALLHIGNFDTGKRTNLKRAVSECVYTSRLYYNKDLQSDNEKIYSQPYRVFKVELYKTHIAAFNEYTEYHINFDDTSKYYTGVIYGKCLTPTPPLQPTVNKKPKPIANKFTTWFLAIASI